MPVTIYVSKNRVRFLLSLLMLTSANVVEVSAKEVKVIPMDQLEERPYATKEMYNKVQDVNENKHKILPIEKAYFANKPYDLKVNGKSGQAELRIPVVVAPGTNEMAPLIMLEPSSKSNVGIKFHGLSRISECEKGSFCLDGQPLVKIQDKAKADVEVYNPIDDPLSILRKTKSGFVLNSPKGFVSSFELVEASGFWKITRAIDSFGNWITYNYEEATGLIRQITYGQEGADPKNYRSVQFSHVTENSPWTFVTSRVGNRKVRSYAVSHIKRNLVSSLTECGFDEKEQPVCSTPLQFKWQSGDGEENDVRLIQIENGFDGVSRIAYSKTKSDVFVQSISDFDKGQIIRKVNFDFDNPVYLNGEFKGYEVSSRHEIGTKVIEITKYGEGLLAPKIVSRSRYFVEHASNGTAVPGNLLSRQEYYYRQVSGVGSYVLSEIRNIRGAGEEKKVSTTKRFHDKNGRLILSTNDAGKIEYKYLDRAKGKGTPYFASNLIVSELHTNLRNKSQLTKNWQYEFAEGRISSSTFSEERSDTKGNTVLRFQQLDRFGNIVRIEDKDVVSEFEFDKEYASYPVSISIRHGDNQEIATFVHDPAHGQVLRQTLPNQTTTINTLDPFGRVVKSISSYETSGDQKGRLEIAEVKAWNIDVENRIEETVSVTVAGDGANPQTTSTTKKFDGFGNLLQTSKLSADTFGGPIEFYVNYDYSLEGWRKEITHPEKGAEVLYYDRAGRVLRSSKSGYGSTNYTYDAFGRLSNIETNDQKVAYEYDTKGRLISKSRPGEKIERYFYETDENQQISKVKLPSGHQIAYRYDKEGRVINKRVDVPVAKGEFYSFNTGFEFKEGRLSGVLYPDGSKLQYSFDDGALTDIKWMKGHRSGETVASYEYFQNPLEEAVLKKTLGNGLQEKFKWGAAGYLSSIEVNRPISAKEIQQLSHLDYKFDEKRGLLSQSKRMELTSKGAAVLHKQFSYNEERELNGVKSSSFDQEQPIQFFKENYPDKLPTKQVVQRGGLGIELSFDGRGNVVSKTQEGQLTKYEFDAENNLVKSVIDNGKNRTITEYIYDHTGQRLAKISVNGDATYYLNPFYEFKVRKDGRMQETKHVWDQTARIASYTSEVTDKDLAAFMPANNTHVNVVLGEGFTHYIERFLAVPVIAFGFLIGFIGLLVVRGSVRNGSIISFLVIISFLTSSLAPTVHAAVAANENFNPIDEISFYHSDMRGSVYTVSDENGLRKGAYSYSPYGEIEKSIGDSGKDSNVPVFAGHEYDAETSLYYMGARYYDPSVGIFITPDPARSRVNPYEYANSNPITLIDPDGRAGDEAPLSRWQRFKNWTGISNWRCCGARDRQVVPDDWGGAPTDEEKAEFDEYHRGKSVEGWTRFGGYLQSLLVAPILAYAFPTSKVVGGEEIVPGYAIDVVVSAIKVTIFSAFGKAYTAVEALQWEQRMEEGVTPRDGYIMLAKRMAYKVGIQVPLFTSAAYFQRYISGFPMLDQDDFGSDLGYLLAQYTIMSIFGNLYLLPYYYGSKPWSATGDIDPDYRQLVADSTGVSGLLKKTGLYYRDFSNRREYWSEDRGGFFRTQYGWYALYVTHMYALYHLGSAGYYSGYAMFGGIASSTGMGFDWGMFTQKWIKNIVSLELSPASSPLALINCRMRWSMTCLREVSPLTPETGCLVRCLGPTGGLRISKYMDSSYASDYRIVEWLIETGRRPAPAAADIESGASGDSGPRIVVIEEAVEQGPNDGGAVEMEQVNEPFDEPSDHDGGEEMPPRELERVTED